MLRDGMENALDALWVGIDGGSWQLGTEDGSVYVRVNLRKMMRSRGWMGD